MVSIDNLADEIMKFDYRLEISLATSVNMVTIADKSYPYFPSQKLEFVDDDKRIIFNGFSIDNKYSTLAGLMIEAGELREIDFERVGNETVSTKGLGCESKLVEYIAKWGSSHETIIRLFLDDNASIETASQSVIKSHALRINHLMKNRVFYLQSLSENSDKIDGLFRNNIQKINQQAVEEVDSIETFTDVDFDKMDPFLRGTNVVLLYLQSLPTGRLIRDFKYHMEGTAWRYLGGDMLGNILDNQVECIKEDISLLKNSYSKEQIKDMKISFDKLENACDSMSMFSGRIDFISKKMKRAYDALYDNWKYLGIRTGFKPNVIENIKKTYDNQKFVNAFRYEYEQSRG